VAARTIEFGLSTRAMQADTQVRSTIQPQSRRGRGGADGKLPSMLSPDEPVTVTSNRLDYKGASAKAVYSGNVLLWQGVDTKITAPTIEIDDKSGNLNATGGVTTTFVFQETDRKTGARRAEVTRGTSETFTYDDNKRLAVYTVKAQITGLQGVVSGDRIELFMKAAVNELERAEAYGANGQVKVREGNRLATGSHLTYTAADDQYLLVGTPVEVIEMKDGTCSLSRGHTATFNRTTEQASIQGTGSAHGDAETLKACPAGFLR
jgi:lipopolysaccharide transport protein LptA